VCAAMLMRDLCPLCYAKVSGKAILATLFCRECACRRPARAGVLGLGRRHAPQRQAETILLALPGGRTNITGSGK
jgi:hypothetical protein